MVNAFINFRGLAIAFNVPGIKSINLTATDIVCIYNGSLKYWNDPILQAHNPGMYISTYLLAYLCCRLCLVFSVSSPILPGVQNYNRYEQTNFVVDPTGSNL